MRTRFLTTDYFNSNQTLEFLRLPLPHVQPPPNDISSLSSYLEQELLRCIDSSSSSISLQIDSFPIQNALSKFFSDVFPHTIDAEDCASPTSLRLQSSGLFQVSEKGSELAYEEIAIKNCRTSNSEITQERINDTTGRKNGNMDVLMQLEMPELDQDLENDCMSEREKIRLLAEVQECDDNLEMLNTGLADSYHCDISESVYTVRSICLDYVMEENPQIPEDFTHFVDNVCSFHCLLPLFEVDEMGMEDFRWACIEDELHSFVENIEIQHCTNSYDLELNCQVLLGSAEIGILEFVDDHHTSKLPLDIESLNSALHVDILQIVETLTGMMDAYLFEELEMLDSDFFEIFEANSIYQITKEQETSNELFHIDRNFKSFDDLIVSSELAVIDDSFISLPVPALKDDEHNLSLHVIITDIFTNLEPVPLSTSDEIYLDWNLLGEDKCSNNVVTAIQKLFNDVQESTIDLSQLPNGGSMLMLDLLLSGDPLDCLNVTDNKVEMPSDCNCIVKQEINTVSSSSLSDDDCQIIENFEKTVNAQSEKVASSRLSDEDCQIIEDTMLMDNDFGKPPSSSVSMSHFNDLDFFLNPRKATGNMKNDRRVKASDDNSGFSNGFHKRKAESPVQRQQSHAQFHTLNLPANFIILIDILQSSYLAVLGDDRKLDETGLSMTTSDGINLLGLSEQSLMEHVSKQMNQQSFLGHGDGSTMDMVTLCAIKRMAWCLCFWGIYTLHLFVCKLFRSLDFLKSRLYSVHSLIEEAYVEVDKEITKSHPSLAIIKDILQLDSSRNSKVLILAQRFLWGPLKRLLTSMDIPFTEVEDNSNLEKLSALLYDFFDGGATGPRDHLKTACLLLSLEDISSSILMQKFDIILEYGGSSGMSKVSTLCPKKIGTRSLHFLKVGLNGAAKALCEGILDSSSDRSRITLEDLLNFGSIMDNHILGSSEAARRTNPESCHRPVFYIPHESKPTQPNDLSFPNVIIVVNTQNSDKDMIISRRSTYQKILALEKRGGQVVERDLTLPVDIVVDATTCIVWYDYKNIASKTIAQDEASSSIPICIDNISANILTSLSFAFTTCILIFEGESNFLGLIMELADELYAAAAGLGIHLQIFCSYSSELTDEIILGSVGQAMKSSKGLLPRLPETETLAESFLTKFPSINPLSAHAILSSGCTLLEFLELSPEARIQALRKYHVPDESINLFSFLCKYGELEGTKSGLTDCSSSISSPPDSGNFVHKINSEDRKRKFVPNSFDATYDSRCPMPSRKYADDKLISQSMRRPLDSDLLKGLRISPKSKFFSEEVFSQGGLSDTTSKEDPSNPWWKSNATGESKILQTEDGFAPSSLLLNDRCLDQEKIRMTTENTHEYDGNILQDLHEDLIDEANIYSRPMLGGDFQAAEKAVTSSPFVSKTVTSHSPKKNRTARRLSFGASSYPTFPSAEEMNIRYGLDHDGQKRAADDFTSVGYDWSNGGLNPQKEPMGGSFMEKSRQKFRIPSSKEKDLSSYGETPLSKAIKSDNLQRGSPWTIDFLNRIKEKRRLLHQRQPFSASEPSPSHRGDVNRVTKRRTPSILEFYKYQGGSSSTPSKVTKQRKRQKQDTQPVNEKPSGFISTWTPTDKKASRTLSFATGGTRGQSKLVWRDNASGSQRSRFSD